MTADTIRRIAHLAPSRLVTRALGCGLITRAEANVYRDLEAHDAWFRTIESRLDACQDRERRAEIRNILNLYFAGRRLGLRCGL